jgi:hypothetical protein
MFMKSSKVINALSVALIGFSALSILMVSLMAFKDPQAVMDLVHVKLTNTDAYSSIRGVYGGVGMTICILFVYLAIKDTAKGLALISIFWGFYAFSRIMTSLVEGPLGAFGQQWLRIELVFCLLSLITLVLKLRVDQRTEMNQLRTE